MSGYDGIPTHSMMLATRGLHTRARCWKKLQLGGGLEPHPCRSVGCWRGFVSGIVSAVLPGQGSLWGICDESGDQRSSLSAGGDTLRVSPGMDARRNEDGWSPPLPQEGISWSSAPNRHARTRGTSFDRALHGFRSWFGASVHSWSWPLLAPSPAWVPRRTLP